MTTVPPANSTPLGIPFVHTVTRPAMMITHDRMIACHRQRRKSKWVSLKICIFSYRLWAFSYLNTQRRGLTPVGQLHLEDGLRHEDRREQIRRQTDDQRQREPANRPGAELEQEGARDERRHVRVHQRPEHAAEAGVDGGADPTLRLQLFLDALEDQHAGV